MTDMLANFVLNPPAWPVLLVIAAAALLLWEIVQIVRDLLARHEPVTAILLAIAVLLAGPLVAAAAGANALLHPELPGRRGLLGLALRGSLVGALALAVMYAPVGGGLVAVGACTVIWAIRSYARITMPLKRPWPAVLLALRLAVVLLIVVTTLRPELNYQLEEYIRPAVLIGLDTSGSMQRRDVPTGKTDSTGEADAVSRIHAATLQLRLAKNELAKLSDAADVEVFAFAGGARPLGHLPGELSLDPAPRADGKTTALGDAPMAAFNDSMQRGQDVAAVILISDGCGNTAENLTPEDFALRMAAARAPVYTVGVGGDQVTAALHVLNVKELTAPEQVAAFNRLPIQARIEAFGLAGREVRVTYRFGEDNDGGPERIQTFAVKADQEVLTPQFMHIPLAAGFQRLTVSAEVVGKAPRDLAGAASASKLVQVVDSELRVLYVEGKFRYEMKFITQALAAANRFSIDRRILLQNDAGTPVIGEHLEDWLRYHAIIFGDVSADQFSPAQIDIIRDLVRKYGKGFCMIGGSRTFGRGGWERTALADVMGVSLANSNGQIDREVQVTPTTAGLTHGLMKVVEEGQDVAAAWRELPPLPGCNLLVGVKDGAVVLAATPQGEPLIVAQNYGSGRSLAIAFDMSWMWVTATAKDTGDYQRRFWRQVSLYLCAPKGNVWITTDKTSYELRRLLAAKEGVDVTAGVEDAQGLRLTDAPVQVTLTSPDGKTAPLTLATEKDRRFARLTAFQVPQPGTYKLKISAEVVGKTLTSEHGFEVLERDLEAIDVLANFKLLQRLSGDTSGRFVPLSELGGLLGKLSITTHPRRRVRAENLDFAASLRWPLVAALVALLCAEWIIRKRRGLV